MSSNYVQVAIVKLKMDKDRKKILDRRAKGRAEALGKDKGKILNRELAMSVYS
jgi:large subunit ribosomal protein L26e